MNGCVIFSYIIRIFVKISYAHFKKSTNFLSFLPDDFVACQIMAKNPIITGLIQTGIRTRCLGKNTKFMTIYRISVGKMTTMFSIYFNFNTNVLANIW